MLTYDTESVYLVGLNAHLPAEYTKILVPFLAIEGII
jgi:hypothetical protein